MSYKIGIDSYICIYVINNIQIICMFIVIWNNVFLVLFSFNVKYIEILEVYSSMKCCLNINFSTVFLRMRSPSVPSDFPFAIPILILRFWGCATPYTMGLSVSFLMLCFLVCGKWKRYNIMLCTLRKSRFVWSWFMIYTINFDAFYIILYGSVFYARIKNVYKETAALSSL